MEPTRLVECRELRCGYHGRAVLTDVAFSASEGQVTALLGPNGSGKSTLIRALSGLVPPMSGEILLGGKSIKSLSEAEVACLAATVPQEETHRFGFSVREVVAMGRLSKSQSFFDSDEDLKVADAAMERADCLELAERSVTELSGGERQRVLIARALAQETPVLLLDEPTSHLDVGHQMAAAKLFRELAEAGKAVIVAVHDLNLVSSLADRAVLLQRGRVAADLESEEMLNDPILDAVYGVKFERFRGVDGRARVYPVA